jgi:hypothetical protein
MRRKHGHAAKTYAHSQVLTKRYIFSADIFRISVHNEYVVVDEIILTDGQFQTDRLRMEQHRLNKQEGGMP